MKWFVDWVKDYHQWLVDTLFDVMTQMFAWVVEGLTWAYFTLSDAVLLFAWGVASQIMMDLNISSYVLTAWNALSPESRQILAFFRVPEIVNVLMTFGVTKYVLKFIPFF